MKYDTIIQKTINWIENNLHEDISSTDISSVAGFSKYHFHRVFLSFTGMSFANYIRIRRLTNAANLLINTEEKIIDIAFYYQSESQESFTRAFRKYYGLPPGRYRKLMTNVNKKKEDFIMNNEIKGWFISGSDPFDYEMGIDHTNVYQGKASGFLKSKNGRKPNGFATMMQQFSAKSYKNNRMKLSAFIKTDNVQETVGLWMRIDNKSEDILQFDNMSDRPIVGTNNWNIYSIVLDVPDSSEIISFGLLLQGSGKAWIDGIRFTSVDKNTPSTNMNLDRVLLDKPINLTFED